MALMLRKACQPILNDADLDAYHADIDDKTKNLCLYTPCGKHFAFVYGVRFGKVAPTAAEIEFATELLTHWLQKNKKTIEDYLIAWEAEQRLRGIEAYALLEQGYRIELSTKNDKRLSPRTGRQEYVTVPSGYLVWLPDHSRICFGSDHTIRSWSISEDTTEGVKNGYKISLPGSTMKKAMSFFEDWVILTNARHRLGEIHAELNSCSES